MKILIWVLNIIQFLIVYFLVFWLLHVGIIVYPGPSGLSIEGLWPAISIGIAGIPWRYYKRFSLFIMSKRMKAPAEEVVTEEASITNERKDLSQSKTKSSGVLNTFFFGYLSLKWMRLVRSLLLLLYVPLWAISSYTIIFNGADYVIICLIILFATTFLIGLASWIIKPFVVKED